MGAVVQKMAYFLTAKYVDESKLDIVSLELHSRDIRYFNLSTSRIASFYHQDQLYYFRECPRVRSRDAYFAAAIEDFFGSLQHLGIEAAHFQEALPICLDFSQDAVNRFTQCVNEKRSNKRFIKGLSQMDQILQRQNYSIWTKGSDIDPSLLEAAGLPELDRDLWDIGIYFMWCMRSAAIQYRTMKVARGKEYSYFYAVRSVSSKIVADALGLGHMITAVQWCCVKTEDGKTRFGIMSQSAPGVRMKDSPLGFISSLQRELMNLNALDVICHQPDHGPNNYNVYEENRKWRVCAFDNDNAKTFFPFFRIDRMLSGCISFLDTKGLIARPCFDRELYDRLMTLDTAALNRQLRPYLNALQRLALTRRIQRLKKALRATVKVRESFLREDRQWNQESLQAESSGPWGRTYFWAAMIR